MAAQVTAQAAKKARHGVRDEVVRHSQSPASVQRPRETRIGQAVQNSAHLGGPKPGTRDEVFFRAPLLRALLRDHMLQQLRAAVAKARLLTVCSMEVRTRLPASREGATGAPEARMFPARSG